MAKGRKAGGRRPAAEAVPADTAEGAPSAVGTLNMNRALRWAVGLVACAAAGGVVGFLMHFVPGSSSGWTGIMAVATSIVVIVWLNERGWWK